MTSIRSVTLEIIRHGPPHNQLLSPLTQYIALSDGFEPTSLHIPYEHRRFLRDLNVLRYTAEPDPAIRGGSDTAALGLIAEDMSRIFAAVPGLIAGLTRPADANDTLTHLRLIFSAAELSLLPFELAKAPAGFPGEGKSLSLQLAGPVVMTREVRAAPGRNVRFPSEPRILFVAASPPAFEAVPTRAHLLALGRALELWVGPAGGDLKRYMHVLADATLREVAGACKQNEYTHVHFLAHGASYRSEGEGRFGIALHDDQGGVDVVSAERLLSALRGHRDHASGLSAPAVVSLATCDSANRARVLVPGGSIAHELHEAGIPLVVASQFPLTMRGSVIMTEALYGGLLRGDDPRWVLHDVRQRLSGAHEKSHDWASLVAYASFHPEIDDDVRNSRYFSARQAMWGASREIDRCLATAERERIDDLRRFAVRASNRLPRGGRHELDALGNIGAMLKRDAHHFFLLAKKKLTGQERLEDMRHSIGLLKEARDQYRLGARTPFEGRGVDSTLDWLIAQWLTLDFVLGEEIDPAAFFMAYYLAQVDATKKVGEPREWAYGSLLDLELIRFGESGGKLGNGTEQNVRDHLHKAFEAVAPTKFMRGSMYRQLMRWIKWWGDEDFPGAPSVKTRIAKVSKLAEHLVEDFAEDW